MRWIFLSLIILTLSCLEKETSIKAEKEIIPEITTKEKIKKHLESIIGLSPSRLCSLTDILKAESLWLKYFSEEKNKNL